MIKIVLYSVNSKNTKSIMDLLDKKDSFKLMVREYDKSHPDNWTSQEINIALFDLSNASRTDIKKAAEDFKRASSGRIIMMEPSQHDMLKEDFLFADDFFFTENLKEELLLRIDFLLFKLKTEVSAESLVVGDLALNLEKYELLVGNEVVVLTFKEFEMLKLLMQNKNKVFTRINLLSTVWGYDYYGGSRTVDVHMRRLRAKIPPPYNNMLKTIRNVGYMFSPGE